MSYKIKIDKDALIDIQEIIEWYNCELQGLGVRFHKQIIVQINALKKRPFIHAIRYEEIRCVVVKKFPFMIHYVLNETEKMVTMPKIVGD